MAKYELSRAADRDLEDIYEYTFLQFGAMQADVYFESLEECFSNLAENPLLGMDASHIRKDYRRFVHQRHTLYYKTMKTGVRVMRVLGPGMLTQRALGIR